MIFFVNIFGQISNFMSWLPFILKVKFDLWQVSSAPMAELSALFSLHPNIFCGIEFWNLTFTWCLGLLQRFWFGEWYAPSKECIYNNNIKKCILFSVTYSMDTIFKTNLRSRNEYVLFSGLVCKSSGKPYFDIILLSKSIIRKPRFFKQT